MSATDHLSVIRNKILDEQSLYRQLMVWKLKTKKIVFTNGCFDILHQGHIQYLVKAKDLGDILIVGVNSDASVKRLGKNPNRPIQDEQARALILASLQFIDNIILFDEDTPLQLIEKIQPAVLVKGADYDAEEKDPKNKKYIVGSDSVRANGGTVATIEFAEGYSTTGIENKITGI